MPKPTAAGNSSWWARAIARLPKGVNSYTQAACPLHRHAWSFIHDKRTVSTKKRTSGNSILLLRAPWRPAKLAVYITNPIFPSKSLSYCEITKPIYVANQPISFAFRPRDAALHHPPLKRAQPAGAPCAWLPMNSAIRICPKIKERCVGREVVLKR
jgi:hypothetical protein